MPQGKLKVKTKLPEKAKSKKNAKKGPAITKRANHPVQSQKKKLQEAHKLKKAVTKSLNKAVEEEMRSRACHGSKKLSKAQEAVAAYNKTQAQTGTTSGS